MSRRPTVALVASTGLAGLLLLSACGGSGAAGASGGPAAQQKPGGPPAAPVSTAKAEKGPIAAGLSFTGDVTASQQVNLAPKVSGLVVKLMADVGTRVTAGQEVAELDHATQDAAMVQAQAGLEVAQAKLDQVQGGGRAEDVAKAQAALAQQQAKLNAMQHGGRPEAVAQAQATLDSATAKLQALQNGSKPQDIQAAQAAEDAAKNKLQALQNGPRPEQILVYQRAIDVAKNNLYSTQLSRDAACAGVSSGQTAPGGRPANCAAGNANVNAAQTALDQANQQYKVNVAPPTSTDVAQAEDALKQAQDTLDKLQNPNTPQDIAQAQAVVASAQQAVALAKAPYTRDDVAGQQAAVNQAVQSVKEAAQPYVAADVESGQANVDAAEANLAAAKVNQDLTKVSAPFAGVVSARLLTEGALASPTTPIFTVVSTDVEVDLPVAQEQLGEIKEGQTAKLTTPALSGQTIDGKIATISPAADPKSRTFLVRVVPATQDGKLRPGMSAAVTIDTLAKPDALLIPRDAVTTDPNSGKQGVYVVQGSGNATTAIFKTPSFGVSDDKNTEVLSGLSAGDVVIASGQTALSNNQRVRLVNGQGAGTSGASGASGRPQGAGSRGGGARASQQGSPSASASAAAAQS